MELTDIAWFILKIVCVVGVVFLLFEFMEKCISKKVLEKRYENLLDEYQEFSQTMTGRLDGYEREINCLHEKFQKYRENVETKLETNENIINKISSYADKMVALNNEFYYKINLIDKALSKSPLSNEDCQELIAEIRSDIESQKRLIEKQKEAKLQRQRDIEIERSRGRGRHLEL